jgi:2-polyprenyl-3-methyl-5-hydroxy-6-metoxy-1,4-benzoquinol methylase
MTIDKNTIIKEISAAFSLDDETAKTALILLEARAKTLDFTFEEYMSRYHPEGIAKRDENLSEQFQGYVQFLKDDATTVLRAGKGANFNTFLHECAHVFRRQLTGELLEQAEKAFGVENGIWTREKEEQFSDGFEKWIKLHHKRDRTRAGFYNKGKNFVDNVYRGMEHVVDIDNRMEEVYENLFNNDKYKFNKSAYEKTLNEIVGGKLPEDPHVFLGMTPRIYEELGFQRLPMAITGKHLYSTLRANGELKEFNYHDLGEEILKQLPDQLKKPLFIVQSNKNEAEIISVIALKNKENKQIIVPVAYSQKGNLNGAEIDVNLVKTIFGMKGFEYWLNEAIKDNRLLYINNKETEPVLGRTLPHTSQNRSIRLPDGFPHSHTASPTTDVFGFLTENIAHYKEIVKKKFPERFPPPGERILYKNNENQQLPLDFSQPVKIPLPNTPENFKQNFIAISGEFKSDTIEAARFILREMTKENRAAALSEMQKAGCTDKDGYHKYLHDILSSVNKPEEIHKQKLNEENSKNKNYDVFRPEKRRFSKESQDWKNKIVDEYLNHPEIHEEAARMAPDTFKNAEEAAIGDLTAMGFGTEEARQILRNAQKEAKKEKEFNTSSITEKKQESEKQNFEFRPFGSWTGFNSRLSLQERERLNNEAVAILERENHQLSKNTISDTDKSILRRYSGFGGISANNERGVLYDYYTSPPVAHLTFQLLEKSGFINSNAKILEPACGTGVFIEYAPKDKNLSFTGVELDERTANVSKHLHSGDNIEIINQSFEVFNLSGKSGSFDHIIGNAPFGERSASLSALDMPEEKSLDNYFVSRSIDNLKENGTMALIVAPGVLENKTNEEFRLSLNKKAQFIGAVKLPNRSFYHTHTQVMPDILLFRKYPKDIQERLSAAGDVTFKTLPLYDDDFVSGKYFEKYPEHIAGTLSEGTGQWGNDEVKGDITPESLEQIISSFKPANIIPEDIFTQTRDNFELPEVSEESDKQHLSLSGEEIIQLENKTLRHGALKISEDGKNIYLLSKNYSWQLVSENEKLAKKINDIKAISNYVKSIQDDMKSEKDALGIQQKQKQCRQYLVDYQRKYNTYPKDDKDINSFIREYPAVQGIYEALLPIDDPLLSKENVYRKQVDILDGHNTAVSALLQLREKMIDATGEKIQAAFPDTANALINEMREHNDVFITTDGIYQLREDFISGDAWKKIDALKAAAGKENDAWKKEKLLYGAGELEKAVGWTPIEDADFSPRSSWVPQEIVRDWASNEEALGKSRLDNLSKNDEGKWGYTYEEKWHENDPLVYYLNGQKQRSSYYDTDSFNKEHDDLFHSFISNHEDYRARLESEYNRKFKTHIVAPVKTYPVEIAGWKDAGKGGKTVKPHQWQSVHHLYRNQCGISALGTGFGKTATGVALMSLLIQEAKAHRHWLQVPNNKIKDWIEEIHSVMPSLKIASIDPEEPGYSSRDKRYAKYQAMARSDADIILMPESSASEIQLSAENDARITQKVSMLYKMEKSDSTARQQEMAALKGEYKADSGKTNVTVCFEDFGCDSIFVDEAHRYKNLFSSTLSRETGMNDGRQSAKAMSLYKKCEYIREKNDNKNVYLLTATPLTNSPLEYYNMMQYVAPEELRRMGVLTIDGFIREFANIELGCLYDWGKGQAKQGNILTGFKNLSTLQNLFFSYTDLQNNPEAIGLEKPSAENHPHIIPSDKKQMAAVRAISVELDRYKSLQAEERQTKFPGQNFLTFYSKMRTASLDIELYDPVKYKNWKNPKLEALANNAFANYQNTKAGQVIFCDRVFSSDASFNIHEKIKNQLITQGFKEKDIITVNGFTKSGGNKSDSQIEKEVSKAIADYNAGKYKVIIGSTACIGEGVNLQKNSSAVHHFDIPFRPSDFIQRNGRVDRQGNEQDKVGLHTYLAAGTIDNYSVNLVQRKANWIDQMLRTKSEVFTNPNDENSIDADELLLALTEEWGDKDATMKRKEALEIQKQEKIKEAQEKQMKANLKSLSLARGALLPLKENTAEYKKRMDQITSLETSLKNNPVFTKHDLLENREPFLYSANDNKIYRKNDVIINSDGTYLVESFNFKKQELFCERLENEEQQRKRLNSAKEHGYKTEKIIKKSFALTDFIENARGYYYNEILYHFEKTSKEEQKMIKDIKDGNFYKLPEDKKEKYYDTHLAVIEKSHSDDFSPVIFTLTENGNLKVDSGRYHSKDEILINPFSTEGRMSILKALEKGVEYPDYSLSKKNMLNTLVKTIPELKDCITQAIDNMEQQKHAKKQEKALEKELLKQASVITGASEKFLESHVSFFR